MRQRHRNNKKKILKITLLILGIILSFVILYFVVKIVINFIPENASKTITKPTYKKFDIGNARSKANEFGLEFTSFDISSKSALPTLVLKNGPIVIFSESESEIEQLTSLQLIMRRLTISSEDARKPKKIDLRFRSPIVTF